MKSFRIVFSVITWFLFLTNSLGQADCKVLKGEISFIYKGECKNGLAHGKGEATGIDNYTGEFRRGLPSGEGIYTWNTGEVYEGSWKNGMRHGYGTYSFISGGRDSVLQGRWVNDKYTGMKETDAVKVLNEQNITRYVSRRRGHGDRVSVRLNWNGMPNKDFRDLMFITNSGTEVRYSQFIGYERVEFPFWGKVTYSTWNSMRTRMIEVLFEFEIIQPGDWELTLYN